MPLTPKQCRMARAGLEWSRAELSKRSGVAQATIAEFEKGSRQSYPRTVRDLRKALEMGGAAFTSNGVAVENEGTDE